MKASTTICAWLMKSHFQENRSSEQLQICNYVILVFTCLRPFFPFVSQLDFSFRIEKTVLCSGSTVQEMRHVSFSSSMSVSSVGVHESALCDVNKTRNISSLFAFTEHPSISMGRLHNSSESCNRKGDKKYLMKNVVFNTSLERVVLWKWHYIIRGREGPDL